MENKFEVGAWYYCESANEWYFKYVKEDSDKVEFYDCIDIKNKVFDKTGYLSCLMKNMIKYIRKIDLSEIQEYLPDSHIDKINLKTNNMKEFKVGDKCYVEYTVTEIDKTNTLAYPVTCVDISGRRETFTSKGIALLGGSGISVLKHIEDIIPKPEFPKWMMVSDDGKEWWKRFVLYGDKTGFISVVDGYDKCYNGTRFWKHSKEIESENTLKEELLQKAQELIDVANELKNKAKEIK